MDIIKSLNGSKIKRRNFFLALGASAIGLFSLSNIPIKFLSSRVFRKIPGSGKINVTPNPLAVSREKVGKANG